MKTNVSLGDRLIRVLLASVLLYLGFFLYDDSALGSGLTIAGGVLFATALVSFCSLYHLLGIHTIQFND